VLWELDDGEVLRCRCRVGHAYGEEALAGEQEVTLETVLWSALRALEEKAGLATRMPERAVGRGHEDAACIHRSRAREAEQQADRVRALLLSSERTS
jgi:two-component system chemotaxis response regulator CheB